MSHVPGAPGGTPADTPVPARTTYFDAISAEDDRLDAVLAAIRADQAAGYLTAVEALGNRIAALEAHLEHCRELRARYQLGE